MASVHQHNWARGLERLDGPRPALAPACRRGPSRSRALLHALPQGLLLIGLGLSALGCRGNRGSDPPIHLQQNMDQQRRYEAQEENGYYRDRRAMRPQVAGTIAFGELRTNRQYFEGVRGTQPTPFLPMRLTEKLLERGRARFDIYCARCHGQSGNGKGILLTRRIVIPPTSYLEPRLLQQPIGHFFQVMSKGIRNMPSFAAQIPVRDRWAIAAYIRALQLAGAASCDQLPADVRAKNGWCKQ